MPRRSLARESLGSTATLVLGLAVLAGLPGRARAQTIDVNGSLSIGESGSLGNYNSGSSGTVSIAPIQATRTYDVANPLGSIFPPLVLTTAGTVQAEAGFGLLKSMAVGQYDGPLVSNDSGLVPLISGTASAEFIDSLTVTGGKGGGFVSFTFAISGVTSIGYSAEFSNPNATAPQPAANTVLGITAGDPSVFSPGGDGPPSLVPATQTLSMSAGNGGPSDVAPPSPFVTELFPITFGQAFVLDASLTTTFSFNNFSLTASQVAALGQAYTPTDNAAATADFFDTVQLTGVQVYDAAGDPLSNPTIVSASGTAYPLGAVPEPSSVALLGLGLGGLALVARRRRGSHAGASLPATRRSSAA